MVFVYILCVAVRRGEMFYSMVNNEAIFDSVVK